MININLPNFDVEFEYNDLPTKRKALQLFPGGIYFLYNYKDECLYIGKSKQIYNRLRGHSVSKFIGEVSYVRIIHEDNPSFRDILETYAIMTFNPKYNIDKVFVDNNASGIRQRISDLHLEKEELSYILNDLESARDDLLITITPPSRRRYNNNFDPDGEELTEGFYEYLEDLEEYHSNFDLDDIHELKSLEDDIESTSAEIKSINEEITKLLRRLQV